MATQKVAMLSVATSIYKKHGVVCDTLDNIEPWQAPLVAQAVTSEFLKAQDGSAAQHKIAVYTEFARKYARLIEVAADPITKELCAINRFLALNRLYNMQLSSDISSDILRAIAETELSVLPSRPRVIYATAISRFMCRYAEKYDRLELVHDSVARLKRLLADATTASEFEQLACEIAESLVLIFEYTSSYHFLDEIVEFHRQAWADFRTRFPSRNCGLFGLKYLGMVGVTFRLRFEGRGDLVDLKKALAYTGFVYRRFEVGTPPSAPVHYAVACRVMYEATGEESYLVRSKDVFDTGLGEQASAPESLDDGALTNFATTLWKLGLARENKALLWTAYSYYELAIQKRGTRSVRNVPRMTNALGVLADLGRREFHKRLSSADQRELVSLVTWFDVAAIMSQSHQMKLYRDASNRFQREIIGDKPAMAQLQAMIVELANMVRTYPRGVDGIVTQLVWSLNGSITRSVEFRRLVEIGLQAKRRIILVDSVGALATRDPARSAGLSELGSGLFGEARGSAEFAMGLLREWGAGRCVSTLGQMFALFYNIQTWLVAMSKQTQSTAFRQDELKRLHAAAALAHSTMHADTDIRLRGPDRRIEREAVFAAFRDELERWGGGDLLADVSDKSLEHASDYGSPVPGDLWLALISKEGNEAQLVVPLVFRQQDGSLSERVIWGIDVATDRSPPDIETQITFIAEKVVGISIENSLRPVVMAVAGDFAIADSFWVALDRLCHCAVERGIVISVGVADVADNESQGTGADGSVCLHRSDLDGDTLLGRYFEACLRRLATDHHVNLIVTGSLHTAFQSGSHGALINYGHGIGADDLSIRGGLLAKSDLFDGDKLLSALATENVPREVLLLSCSAGFLYRFDVAAVGGFVTALMASGCKRIAAAGRPIEEARAFVFGLYFFEERFGKGKSFDKAFGDAGQRVLRLSKDGFAGEFRRWMSIGSMELFKQAWEARLNSSGEKVPTWEEAFSFRSYVVVRREPLPPLTH